MIVVANAIAEQGDWIFTAHNGERVTRDALYYHYAQLMALAGITDWKERNLTYYSTRHYGITKRLQKVDLFAHGLCK